MLGCGTAPISPDNGWLVGNTGQAVLFWKVGDWLLNYEVPIETNGGSGISFSPDSQLVATGRWGSGVRLFDLKSATPIADLEIPKSPPVYKDLEFSPDGGQLIGTADHEGLCIWISASSVAGWSNWGSIGISRQYLRPNQ